MKKKDKYPQPFISTDDRQRTKETEIKLSQDKLRMKSPGGKGSKMGTKIHKCVVDKRISGLYQDESRNWFSTASNGCPLFKIDMRDCQQYNLYDVPTDHYCTRLIVDMTNFGVFCDFNQPYHQEYFRAEGCVMGYDYGYSQRFPISTEQPYQNKVLERTTYIFEQFHETPMTGIARLNILTTEVNLKSNKPILQTTIKSSFQIHHRHQTLAIEDKTVTEDRTISGISVIIVAIVLVVMIYWRGMWRQLKKVGAFVQIFWRRVQKESKRADINKVTVVGEVENNKEEQSPMEFTQSGAFSPATSSIPRTRQLKSPVGTENTTDNVTCISEKLSLPSASTPINDGQYQQSQKQVPFRFFEPGMEMSGSSSSSYYFTSDEAAKQTLDILQPYFLEYLPTDVILDGLRKQNFMPDIDIRDIREQKTTTEKNRLILRAARCRGSKGLNTLMKIVEESQICLLQVKIVYHKCEENIRSHPEKYQSHDETDHDTDDTDNSM